ADADLFEPEVAAVRVPARGEQDGVDVDVQAAIEAEAQPVAVLFDRVHVIAGDPLDPALGHLLFEGAADVAVEATQRNVAADDLGDPRSGAPPDAGELHPDVAAADHGDVTGQLGAIERFVRGHRVLDARDLGQGRPSAGRDEDALRGDEAPFDFHRVRIDDAAAPFDELDAG